MHTESSQLWNEDLAPTSAAQRTWRWYHFAALWVGMVMCIPAYTLAASLIEGGMSGYQAVICVFIANAIVLIPMLLIGHAGAKYGIPYAVLARTSFGVRGARLPALMRAIVACGWYGIQTWFGGQMIYTLGGVLLGHPLGGDKIDGLGINAAQLICFLIFWGIQFWCIFWPSLTAMIGFWATLALNIPDFTRFAKSQKDQVLGQTIGLPAPMGLLALLAVIVTSATVVLYGKALWDPVDLASRMSGAAVLIALVVLLIDTVSVNLAANLVGPAYDFSALNPQLISYKTGGYITAGIALVMMPWKILETTQGYIFTWLIGYSALLGPIAGILIIDYYFIRKTHIVVDDLYHEKGQYQYSHGWNMVAVVAFLIGVVPNIPGFLNAAFPAAFPAIPELCKTIYTYAWFVGLALSGVVYFCLMQGKTNLVVVEKIAS